MVIETGTIRKLGAVSYSPSIVTVALSRIVCEIPALKNGMTLKTGLGVVQGHSKWCHSIDHIRLAIDWPL